MKTIVILLIIFSSITAGVQAQQRQHNPNDQITSLNWDVISSVRFRKISDSEYYPVYGDIINRFSGDKFELEGYIVPLRSGAKQTEFMLSTLPITQCYFCGKNGNPIMIYVQLSSPIRYTSSTIKVEGTLKLENANAAISPPVNLINSHIVAE